MIDLHAYKFMLVFGAVGTYGLRHKITAILLIRYIMELSNNLFAITKQLF